MRTLLIVYAVLAGGAATAGIAAGLHGLPPGFAPSTPMPSARPPGLVHTVWLRPGEVDHRAPLAPETPAFDTDALAAARR